MECGPDLQLSIILHFLQWDSDAFTVVFLSYVSFAYSRSSVFCSRSHFDISIQLALRGVWNEISMAADFRSLNVCICFCSFSFLISVSHKIKLAERRTLRFFHLRWFVCICTYGNNHAEWKCERRKCERRKCSQQLNISYRKVNAF